VKLLGRRLGEIGRGRLVGPDVERTTFEDLAQMVFDDYRVNGRKSLSRAERSVKHLKTWFARARAVDITTDRVSAYIADRMKVAKPATVRLELAALKRMFSLGARAGKVAYRPYLPSIEVRNTRSGFFEEDELRAVQGQLATHLRPLIEFLYATGWRVGEARRLTWRQVDFRAGTVRLEPGTTKNDEGRTFPFGALPKLAALLRAQRDHTSALEHEQDRIVPWVFHRAGKPIRSPHAGWRSACKRAGMPGKLIHDLRRTAVRNLERAGVARSVAMKLTGHKTESIYRRYAIVSESDLALGVTKLAALANTEANGLLTLADRESSGGAE
jgi:integrase